MKYQTYKTQLIYDIKNVKEKQETLKQIDKEKVTIDYKKNEKFSTIIYKALIDKSYKNNLI